MDPSVTAPVAKRADQLVVGDRVPDEHLAFRFNQGPAQVVFVAYEDTVPLKWTFVAYRYPNGQHDSMTIRPEAVLMVYPADNGFGFSRGDGEVTQPIAGRLPAHLEDARTGEVFEVPSGVQEPKCSPECDAMTTRPEITGTARGWHHDDCPVAADRELRDEWTAMVNAEREDD